MSRGKSTSRPRRTTIRATIQNPASPQVKRPPSPHSRQWITRAAALIKQLFETNRRLESEVKLLKQDLTFYRDSFVFRDNHTTNHICPGCPNEMKGSWGDHAEDCRFKFVIEYLRANGSLPPLGI